MQTYHSHLTNNCPFATICPAVKRCEFGTAKDFANMREVLIFSAFYCLKSNITCRNKGIIAMLIDAWKNPMNGGKNPMIFC
jgi:hypothetical protein